MVVNSFNVFPIVLVAILWLEFPDFVLGDVVAKIVCGTVVTLHDAHHRPLKTGSTTSTKKKQLIDF